ncbi:MAG: hypothetical protein IJC00_05390, partial [Clostridia bacterium]|nr:hypothetical protein [Clostridia bacterium]
VDGWVRDIIDTRDFSIDYVAKEGENDYTGYFIRLGMRYVEIKSESAPSPCPWEKPSPGTTI